MKGHEQLGLLFMAKSGWYHGASQASVPGSKGWRLLCFCRLLKAAASFVLGSNTSSTYLEG